MTSQSRTTAHRTFFVPQKLRLTPGSRRSLLRRAQPPGPLRGARASHNEPPARSALLDLRPEMPLVPLSISGPLCSGTNLPSGQDQEEQRVLAERSPPASRLDSDSSPVVLYLPMKALAPPFMHPGVRLRTTECSCLSDFRRKEDMSRVLEGFSMNQAEPAVRVPVRRCVDAEGLCETRHTHAPRHTEVCVVRTHSDSINHLSTRMRSEAIIHLHTETSRTCA